MLDEVDHEALYLQDYEDEMPELESSVDLESLVYDRLGATPTSTMVSTDTEAATDMFGLSMGTPGTLVHSTLGALMDLWVQAPAPRSVEIAPPVDQAQGLDAPDSMSQDDALQTVEQFKDMFKVPNPVTWAAPSPRVDDYDIKALVAKARARSGRRKLPSLLGLIPPPKVPDKQNVVLQAIKKSGVTPATDNAAKKGADGPVSEVVPDPLDLARDAALDAVRKR